MSEDEERMATQCVLQSLANYYEMADMQRILRRALFSVERNLK